MADLGLASTSWPAARSRHGADLFALVAMLAWLGDQPSLAPRADHLFEVIASAILASAGSGDAEEERRPQARR
ncbi:hypothetical protein [Streptomyces sp. NPDC058086]|uniref:hypothetical protein n=1 Tax=Streptomyces sp. NPDC058086 TaxID=3346334 RepID=UPI0036E5CEA9